MKKSAIGLYAFAVFACFSFGIIGWQLHLWPTELYRRAIEAYKAEKERQDEIKQVMSDKNTIDNRKITTIAKIAKANVIDANKMQAGLTLVMVGADAAMLIGSKGAVHHTWQLPFSSIWKKPPHVASPNPDPMTRFIDAHLYSNGDLLAIYHADNDTPYGYGMVKMDKDSHIIWSLAKNVHHNMYVAKDGRIFTLTQSYLEDNVTGIYHFIPPILADAVTILSPDGKEQDSITIIQALLGTPYEQLLYTSLSKNDDSKHDYTHANSVMLLEDDIAAQFPMFKPGQLLVSLRNLNAIVVIDPKTRKVIWAMNGIWKQQHEAQFLANGHLMLFDNQGYYNGEKNKPHSRVLEFDPATGAVSWSFHGDSEKDMFYTSFHGSQQLLPNGNMLIVETGEGNKIIEITHDKKVVWRYVVDPSNYRQNPINQAYRIPVEFLDHDFCGDIKCKDP